MQEACLGWLQDKQISAPACQKFQVHIEALTRFSQIFSADGLNNTLILDCIHENVSSYGNKKWRRWVRSL